MTEYSDDRVSLAQEIYEGLKQRGYWVPRQEDRAGPDLINAIFMALDKPGAERKEKQVPVYEHDCSHCEFIGSYTYDAPLVDGTKEKTADLWVCMSFMGDPPYSHDSEARVLTTPQLR